MPLGGGIAIFAQRFLFAFDRGLVHLTEHALDDSIVRAVLSTTHCFDDFAPARRLRHQLPAFFVVFFDLVDALVQSQL